MKIQVKNKHVAEKIFENLKKLKLVSTWKSVSVELFVDESKDIFEIYIESVRSSKNPFGTVSFGDNRNGLQASISSSNIAHKDMEAFEKWAADLAFFTKVLELTLSNVNESNVGIPSFKHFLKNQI